MNEINSDWPNVVVSKLGALFLGVGLPRRAAGRRQDRVVTVWWQGLDVSYLSGPQQGEAVDYVQVLFAKQQQALDCVQPLDTSTPEHVADLQYQTDFHTNMSSI